MDSSFPMQKNIGEIPTTSPSTGAPNRGGIGSHRHFLTNISLYLSATVEMMASNKTAKYAGLTSDYHF